ncbi:hypothetical protein FACS189490_06320 [Clostridia bacterium]|nr:hypothetical protein FACS189490_06320 [Clostridia bacterium]
MAKLFLSFIKLLSISFSANLHDLGKLAVPNAILNKPGKLTKEEFDLIKRHTYYTRRALQRIDGFEEITEWAANHHEKLNGTGYPFGIGENSGKLDFNARLLSVLDMYQALTERRPYREGSMHDHAIEIIRSSNHGGLDDSVIDGVDRAFKDKQEEVSVPDEN